MQGQIESRGDGDVSQARRRQQKLNSKGFFTQSRREGVAIKQPGTIFVEGDVYSRVRHKLAPAYKGRLGRIDLL